MPAKDPDNISIAHDEHWIKKKFASRGGFIRTVWYRFLYYCGRYNSYKDIDWASVDRLVFVCKGNICRSVFAETVARSMGMAATSCGLDTIEFAPANEHAQRAAGMRGFDLARHQTRPVMYMALKKTDLLIAMEPWQAEFLRENLNRKHQYSLLGLWMKPVSPHIEDPYGASDAYFDYCFSAIEDSVKALARKTGAG